MDNIKFNKLLNEKYFLLKNIAEKHNYSEELLDMITFIYISFYMDFGKICDFPLYDLFNKVKIIYDIGTVNEIAIKNNFSSMPSGSAAVTIFNPNLKVFKDASQKQNPQIILLGTHVDEYLATPALKLEMLAHEVRHALMGYYNTNILLDDNTYYMRSGLQETYYLRNDDLQEKFTFKRTGTTLDEITNTYIIELIINRIMSFKKYKIDNNNLRSYLNSIKTSQPDGRYRSIGYNSEVRLLYPLLLNEMFINLVNNHQFDGNINLVKEFIESNSNMCSYDELCELLDSIYNGNARYQLEAKNNNSEFIGAHINNINKIKSIIIDIQKNITNGNLSNNFGNNQNTKQYSSAHTLVKKIK